MAFHDANADMDILARILADTFDTRDFLKLFLQQAERHADILATILASISARMSMSVSVSVSWNASLSVRKQRKLMALVIVLPLATACDRYSIFANLKTD